jgi:hypothetical protein
MSTLKTDLKLTDSHLFNDIKEEPYFIHNLQYNKNIYSALEALFYSLSHFKSVLGTEQSACLHDKGCFEVKHLSYGKNIFWVRFCKACGYKEIYSSFSDESVITPMSKRLLKKSKPITKLPMYKDNLYDINKYASLIDLNMLKYFLNAVIKQEETVVVTDLPEQLSLKFDSFNNE